MTATDGRTVEPFVQRVLGVLIDAAHPTLAREGWLARQAPRPGWIKASMEVRAPHDEPARPVEWSRP